MTTASVTVHVSITKRGRQTVRAIALDPTGNNGTSRTLKVRVGS